MSILSAEGTAPNAIKVLVPAEVCHIVGALKRQVEERTKVRKAPKIEVEKRAIRTRTLSIKTHDRIERASSQRMYMISRNRVAENEMKFDILGSTGNVYQVNKNLCPGT